MPTLKVVIIGLLQLNLTLGEGIICLNLYIYYYTLPSKSPILKKQSRRLKTSCTAINRQDIFTLRCLTPPHLPQRLQADDEGTPG